MTNAPTELAPIFLSIFDMVVVLVLLLFAAISAAAVAAAAAYCRLRSLIILLLTSCAHAKRFLHVQISDVSMNLRFQ